MEENNQNVFVLPESVTISECQEQFSLLTEKLANNEKLSLDASNVKKVDTAAMQLFTSLFKNNNEKKIEWHEISQEIQENSKKLGLSVHLNINA